MIPAESIQIATRRAVHLERLKAGGVKKYLKTLSAGERAAVFIVVENWHAISNAKDANKTVAELQRALAASHAEASEELFQDMAELAAAESDFAATSIEKVTRGAVLRRVEASKAYAAAKRAPIHATGELLETWIKKNGNASARRIGNIVRTGWHQGLTGDEMRARVVGTKARKYKDGAYAKAKREAEAVIRTSYQHVSSSARQKMWEDNSDIVTGYEWVSTLDRKTSSVCRSLDGRKYKLGKGPLPPIHINCRSATVADLDDGLDFLDAGAKRSAERGPVDSGESYYPWLKKQGPAFQKQAIGAKRAKLLRDGGLTEKRFSELQLDKNLQPLTIEEMRKLEPEALARAGV